MALPTTKTQVTASMHNTSMLIYGEPKAGKSTLASNLGDDDNKILFFTTEAGDKFLEIYKWTKDNGSMPTTWEDFKQCLNEFYKSEYKTLAIDTVGHLIGWCESSVLKANGARDESEGKYGNIFREIKREFTTLINKLGQINKGIIFISHVNPKKEKEGVIYPDLPEKYENLFNGMVDYIFYCYMDEMNNRLIRTKGTQRIVAGDRSGKLPSIIKMDAAELKSLIK